jgi:RNA polymerase sigma factor (sigma-70 family)
MDRFPTTRGSILLAVGSSDAVERHRAWDVLVSAYWKPVYKYLRVKWRERPEDAEDSTQAFFARSMEKGIFERYDPSKARFRTYLRLCLDGFVANRRKAARRLKRGGGADPLPLDFAGAEGELRHHDIPDPEHADMDAWFHREWVRALFGRAVEELRRSSRERGREIHLELFERYDLEGSDAAERPSYGELAAELGLTTIQVTNYLASIRRDFRRLVLEALREATGSEAELRAEARELLGVEL